MHEDDKKYERCKDEDDPRRCQARGPHNQCMMVKVEGSDYCHLHGGHAAVRHAAKDELYNLNVTRFKARLVKLGNSSQIMSLRDEIGVARLLLENIINQCRGPVDLITYSPQISKQTDSISKLIRDCHYIESKMGNLLDRGALMTFGAKVIDIINENIDNDETKKLIAMKIVAVAEELQNED